VVVCHQLRAYTVAALKRGNSESARNMIPPHIRSLFDKVIIQGYLEPYPIYETFRNNGLSNIIASFYAKPYPEFGEKGN
jgi:hypothetical protein